MSSPRSSRSTPRKGAATPASPAPSSSSRARSRAQDMDVSELSDLAAPLPSSPPEVAASSSMPPPRSPGPLSDLMDLRGPGSVRVSEIDLSSPLNYGTPGSIGSSLRTGSKPTPIRLRSDIQSERRIRQVNLTGVQDGLASSSQGDGGVPTSGVVPVSDLVPPSENSENAPTMVIWGTDVQVNDCKRKFKRFVDTFMDIAMTDEERFEGLNPEEPYYLQRLAEINILQYPFLNVDCGHINEFDEDLYRQLICYPQEVIPTFDMAVNEMFFEKFPETELEHQIQVRPYNADHTKNMRSLNPEDIDQLITVTGMVIRASDLIPELSEGWFKCSVCHYMAHADVERGRIQEPVLCPNCNTNHSFGLVHNRSKFSDKQMVKLQESPDDMPAGQTPHTVVLFVHGELVDKVMPGDRVAVTGVYRAVPHRANPKTRNLMSVYKTHIDVVHFSKMESDRLRSSDDNQLKLPEERVELLKGLALKPDIYERLARAIAPSIYENEDVKKGILLQLFGGTRKDFSKTGRGNFRAELNILLCGDPGTSKSQLLTYIHSLVPRSQYTSGKGSSAVGLTAYITKDPDTRQLVLQTGALVLADNGICCIDEFDKMSDSTRSVLHEVMEQQTLSIAKAGIICQLNARTSVLAAANPKESEWNPRHTVVENLELPATLVSRFDLIFLILDQQDEVYDKRLARHLVSLYYRDQEQRDEELFSMSILRDYITYAKANFQPKLTDEAGQKLIDHYVSMRKIGAGRGQITAYPRQLESLIRLSEAHARMRFSHHVEGLDVDEAYRLQREALKQSATDPSTGLIDVSILATGQSSETRRKRQLLAAALKGLLQKKGKVLTHNYDKIFQELRANSDIQITRDMFEDAVKELQDLNFLNRMGQTIRIINALA